MFFFLTLAFHVWERDFPEFLKYDKKVIPSKHVYKYASSREILYVINVGVV